MHITNDTLINTAALTVGMRITDDLLTAWEQGCVELYQAIGEWAVIITEEERHLSQALKTTGDCWPGVFAYEVTEDVGTEIRNKILCGEHPADSWVKETTRRLVKRFCDDRGVPATVEAYMNNSMF